MFKYQDLIHSKRVGSSWASSFSEWIGQVAIAISQSKTLQNQISEDVKTQDLDTGEIQNASKAVEALAFLEQLTNTLFEAFDNNREWHKGTIKRHEAMGIPAMPVQYNIDKYFHGEFSDNAMQVIDEYKNAAIDILEELFLNKDSKKRKQKHADVSGLPRGENYYKVKEFVDKLRSNMVDILNKNQLYFSKPAYDNLWLYLGEIDDETAPNTYQGIHVITYTPEQWDNVHFQRDYFKENKFVLREDECVVSLDHFSVLKETGEKDSYFKDGHSYVHFDKDHRPIDVLTYLPDDDILDEWMRGVYGTFDKNYGIHNIKDSDDLGGASFNLVTHCHREVSYLLIRTYLIIELFAILNTRNSQLDEGEKVLVERPTKGFHNTKKARKRIKSKLGIDALDEFFVMKELVINPLLTTETNADSIYSPNDGPLKLREHMRAGHYKVYLPEKPRFGVYHKNNIGRFWYKPTTVAKNSNKGVVVKDYKIEK